MTDRYVLVIDDHRARLEQQRRRFVKWLEQSAEPSSTPFWAKCDRLREIERELETLEAENG